MSFTGKVVLITGASSGIGRAAAIQFAKEGACVILVARRKEKLDQIDKELKKFNASTLVCECDVSDKTQVKKMSKMVLEKYESVDILVNNAGARFNSFERNNDGIELTFATNHLCHFLLTINLLNFSRNLPQEESLMLHQMLILDNLLILIVF